MTKPRIDNAPGLIWRARAKGLWVAYWAARPDLVKRGYRPETAVVWRGQAPTPTDVRLIQDACQERTAEMLAFSREGERPKVFGGTVTDLIDVYRRDPDSPFQKVRTATKRTYNHDLDLICRLVGERRLEKLSGKDFIRWYENWRKPKVSVDKAGKAVVGPERIRRAHGLITMVRIVLGFGAATEIAHCMRLSGILAKLRFEGSDPRSTRLDAIMAAAIRAKAHEVGLPSIALAQAFQFECSFRQKDVIGEWVPVSEPGMSDVLDRGQKWVRGLRWEEIDQHMILRHETSKTGHHAVFDLSLYPMVVEELARVPVERRRGPVVVSESTGIPYRTRHYADAWRSVADAAGVPAGVWNMDSRAGGITEATDAGADLEAARHHAGHRNASTTQRYSRTTSHKVNEVARLRAKHRNGSGT